MATNVHQIPLLDEARKGGAEIWTVDPLRTATARRYDRHLQPRPGTDLELALGLGREILALDRWDRDLALGRGEGFDTYRRLAEPWTLQRTADATGLNPDAIADLARRLTGAAPLLLRVGYGVQRQRRSAATVWAIAVLSLLTGSWRQVGGGLLLSNSDAFPLKPLAGGPRPQRHVNMVQLGAALTELADPPVRALVVYNSNPAATAPDQARVLRGLARDDLFTVVHEQMMTDTAKWADFVLPAAMAMETTDLHTSYWHRYIQLSRPAAPPAGESVSNAEFFRRLAAAMGLRDPALQADDVALIEEALDSSHPWLAGITLGSLLETPVQKVRLSAESRPFLDTPLATPSGRFRLAPPPGTAVDGPATHDADFPLSLLTPSTRETIKSSFGNIASLRRGHPQPELLMAAEDMARLGIREGQAVRAYNARGSVELVAVESTVPQPGTVVSYAVRWNHEGGGRNVNQLTSAALADFGGGATFYSARVAVEAAP
jgi:anaerobic selenocysteine-containing dehydrogenase